jgi:hypothetical protein
MQKLTGISSGQNNKSCSINSHGSKKIGFTCFWIFCDFLRNLQDSAIQSNYWSYLFAIKALERLECLQCGPRGGRPARAAGIRRARRGSWPVNGKGMVLGALGFDLGTVLVGRCGRRWPSAAHRGGGRCCLSCGEVRAGEKRWRGSVVSLGARTRGGVANWLGTDSRLGLAAAGTQGAGAARCDGGRRGVVSSRRGEGKAALSKEATSCYGEHAMSQARRSTAAASVGVHQDGSRRRTGR